MAAAAELTAHWARLNGPHRLHGVDLARGLAVVGMIAAHLVDLPEGDWADAATWPAVADGRSSILFATLAGVSLALVAGGPRPVAGDALHRARLRIVVRAGAIWVLGVLLVLTGVPVYVILPAYAILFVLALPFLSLRAPALFILAGAAAVAMPAVVALLDAMGLWATPGGAVLSPLLGWHYPFPVWIAFVLCGLGLGRLQLRALRVQFGLVAAGAAAATTGYGLAAFTGADAAGAGPGILSAIWTARPHSSGILEAVGSGGFAVCAIGVCLLVCRTVLTWVALPLRAIGSMPLSAYTGHLVAWAIVAAAAGLAVGDLTGFRDLHPFAPFALAVVASATAVALLAGRGPLEALIDRLARAVVPEAAGPARGEAADRLER